MRSRHLAAVLVAVAMLGRPSRAPAAIDLTGSWALFVEDVSPSPIFVDIVQTGSQLALSTGGVPLSTFLATIDPATGVMQVVFVGGSPCPAGFIATASPDGNAFAGYGGQTETVCNGPVISCMCSLLRSQGVRGCRLGAPGGCCGDGIVTPDEQCDDGPEALPGHCCSPTCQVSAPGAACAADGNGCTADVCDGSATCTHTPGPAGVACTDDGNFCTVDACDAAGACLHTPGPLGVACEEDGDACTTDACDGSGACVHAPGPDADGDGICDVLDPCTGGAPVTRARLKVAAAGVAVTGEAMLAPALVVDPIAGGITLRVDAGGGQYLRSIPGGAWVEATRTGWKGNRAGTAFRYRDSSTRIRLTRLGANPGRLRMAIDRFDDPPGLPGLVAPARAVVLFGPSVPGRCAEALFPASACQIRRAGLSCR